MLKSIGGEGLMSTRALSTRESEPGLRPGPGPGMGPEKLEGRGDPTHPCQTMRKNRESTVRDPYPGQGHVQGQGPVQQSRGATIAGIAAARVVPRIVTSAEPEIATAIVNGESGKQNTTAASVATVVKAVTAATTKAPSIRRPPNNACRSSARCYALRCTLRSPPYTAHR